MTNELPTVDDVRLFESPVPTVARLEIEIAGSTHQGGVDADGLISIICKCVDALNSPAMTAATKTSATSNPTAYIDASQISIGPGRRPGEAALTMDIGAANLVVFLQMSEVLRAFSKLMKEIGPVGPAPAAH